MLWDQIPHWQPVRARDSSEWLVNSFSEAHVSRPKRGHQVSAPSVSPTERMKLTLPVIKLPWLNLQRVNSQHMSFDCNNNLCLHLQDVVDLLRFLPVYKDEHLRLGNNVVFDQNMGKQCAMCLKCAKKWDWSLTFHSLGNFSHEPGTEKMKILHLEDYNIGYNHNTHLNSLFCAPEQDTA